MFNKRIFNLLFLFVLAFTIEYYIQFGFMHKSFDNDSNVINIDENYQVKNYIIEDDILTIELMDKETGLIIYSDVDMSIINDLLKDKNSNYNNLEKDKKLKYIIYELGKQTIEIINEG